MLYGLLGAGGVVLLLLIAYYVERRACRKKKRDPVVRELGAFVRRTFGPWD